MRTIADRAGIELKDEDGKPFHCGELMPTKGGLFGPDYAKCNTCGLMMANMASPHINGGVIFSEEVYEEFGEVMWRYKEGTNGTD